MTHHDEQTARYDAWYRANGYYHDTVSARKELMEAAWQARDAIATTREAELLAVIRVMDGALDGMCAIYATDGDHSYTDGERAYKKAQKARRLAEQVV